MTPYQSITVSSIWLSVGFTGFFTTSQPTIAVVALFALFATGVVLGKDQQ